MVLVTDSRAENQSDRNPDRVVRHAFALGDVTDQASDVVMNRLASTVVEKLAVDRLPLLQKRHCIDYHRAPQRNSRVAVLADDVGVGALRRYPTREGNEIAEPGRIEHRARTEEMSVAEPG